MVLDNAMNELVKLAQDTDHKKEKTVRKGMDDNTEEVNIEGWVDEWEEMSEEELDKLEQAVQPVRVLLTKVRG